MNSGSVVRTAIYCVALFAAAGGAYMLGRSTAEPAAQSVNQPAAASPRADSNQLKIVSSYLRTVGIETEQVSAGNLAVDVIAPGTVAAAANGVAVVTAHASGTIIRLTKQLGDSVRTGELLGLVESREAAALAADRRVAETKATLARSALAREQELYNQRVTPRQDLERAQADLALADAELQRSRDSAAAAHLTEDGQIAMISPLNGTITALSGALGKFVAPETEVFRITDPRFVQIEAAVTPGDANRIRSGDAAKVILPSGAVVAASVRSIAPKIDEQSRTATVVLALTKPGEQLSPGAVVQVEITPKASGPAGVVVPEDAVQNIDGRNVVFVRTQDGFDIRPIVAGARNSGRVSILSGINPGETIATTNAFFLKAELGKGVGEDE